VVPALQNIRCWGKRRTVWRRMQKQVLRFAQDDNLVMVMMFGFADRDDAAVGDFAFDVFELDGGVDHAEIMLQDFFHVTENAFAGRGRDVGDGDVAGERVAFRADAPDVQVVDVIHALNLANGRFDVIEPHAARSAFQQDVHGLAQDADRGPENQGADPE